MLFLSDGGPSDQSVDGQGYGVLFAQGVLSEKRIGFNALMVGNAALRALEIENGGA